MNFGDEDGVLKSYKNKQLIKCASYFLRVDLD